MANYTKLTDLFTGIANAIRGKTGNSNEIVADNFPSEISNIVTVQEGTADATASASNIDSGKTAYVNGEKVTGTSIKVDTSDATASASNILTGQTAYVNGSKVTGTMADQGAKTSSLNCGGSYTIPAGYHNGSGKITANSLASQTSATATASDIDKGKTAYVNGSKITGTSTKVDTSDATVTADTLKNGITAYGASGEKITGTKNIPSYTAEHVYITGGKAYSSLDRITCLIGAFNVRYGGIPEACYNKTHVDNGGYENKVVIIGRSIEFHQNPGPGYLAIFCEDGVPSL